MTDKEKYDFIDHVVHLTLVEENRLLNEHGGEYSRLEEDGIDSNEYYRIITERVINILKKNNKYMQEVPVSDDFEEALTNEWKDYIDRGAATVDALEDNTQELAFAKGFYRGAKWQKEQMMKDSIDGEIGYWNIRGLSVNMDLSSTVKEGDKVKVIVIKND